MSETPNGKNTAIKADYNMDIGLYDIPRTPYGTIIPTKVTVYHELVCLDKRIKQLGRFDNRWGYTNEQRCFIRT